MISNEIQGKSRQAAPSRSNEIEIDALFMNIHHDRSPEQRRSPYNYSRGMKPLHNNVPMTGSHVCAVGRPLDLYHHRGQECGLTSSSLICFCH